MPNHDATKKSLRKDTTRRLRNRAQKSKVRTLIKSVRQTVESKNQELALQQLKAAISSLDTAAKKRVIHPRNASRRKARLMRLVNTLENSA
ncbi:MAG: 30S ribosomal protein S20 [bacterium]|jgi:small subunit ribosomal protein S20